MNCAYDRVKVDWIGTVAQCTRAVKYPTDRASDGGAYCWQHRRVIESKLKTDALLQPALDEYHGIIQAEYTIT